MKASILKKGRYEMNEKKIEAADQKTYRLIQRELGDEMASQFRLPHLNNEIDLDSKSRRYESSLKIFKYLFRQTDPDYKMGLWNSFHLLSRNFRKEDFTDDEFAYLNERFDAFEKSVYPPFTNVNSPFRTNRLFLRPSVEEDSELYLKHLKKDGDFTMVTYEKYTAKSIKAISDWFMLRQHIFSIIEKASGTMVGYLGFHPWSSVFPDPENSVVVELEYYLFKPYRQLGYAKEAVTALCERAFAGKLRELEETNYYDIFRKKKAKIEVIRALIRADNTPSRKLVESCGFKHTGTLHKNCLVEGKYLVDTEIYELEKENAQ